MRWIWDHSMAVAVHHQVEFFQHCLTNQHFIAKDKCFFKRISFQYLKQNRAGYIHDIIPSIRTFHHSLAANS